MSFRVCRAKLGMWYNGISIFPWNQTWQSMKGNATFHIPSSQPTRMPPTTPEHSPIRETCVSWMFPATQSRTRQQNTGCRGNRSEIVNLLLLLLFCLSPALFVLISFCEQPPGRQVKVCPHTTHHFPHMRPGGRTQDARGKGKPKQLTQHRRHRHLQTETPGSICQHPDLFSLFFFFPSPIKPLRFYSSSLHSPVSYCMLLISVSSKVCVF